MKWAVVKLLVNAAVLLLALGAGCTKTNPNLCCISETDCAAIGLPNGTQCDSGFACQNHDCVAAACGLDSDCTDPLASHCGDGLCRECSAVGQCPQAMAACNLNTYSCEVCSNDNDCKTFAAAPHCGGNGACVECTKSEQCGAAEPVCGTDGACRLCQHDQECASGACDADGTCVDAAPAIYISPTGIDAGACVQTQPCKSLQFGEGKVTAGRFHLVFATGDYNLPLGVVSKPRVAYHGNGSRLAVTDADFFPAINVASNKMFVSDFEISTTGIGAFGGGGVAAGSELTLRHVNIAKTTTVSSMSGLKFTWTDSQATNFSGLKIDTSPANVTLRRLTFTSPTAVLETTDVVLAAENINITQPKGNIFNFTRTSGSLSFVTIADTDVTPGVPHIVCSQSPVVMKSSIIWTPRQPTTINGNCTFAADNIAGPVVTASPAINVSNADPLFVDMAAKNYHLQPTSPAIDKADTGPATDLDGTPRPQGAKFDLGAFEAK
jgi:hypothetical protein